MAELAIYLGLFMAAFAAATILPMQSEAALVGLLLTGEYAVRYSWPSQASAMSSARCSTGYSVAAWNVSARGDGFLLANRRWTGRRFGIDAMDDGRCWQVGCRSLVIRSQLPRAFCESRYRHSCYW